MSKRTWKLTAEHKAYIVVRLACYDSPRAIVKSLKEDFGIEVTRKGLERYNPTLFAGRACAEQWATLFYETRRKLVEGRADIGAAHKMVRIRWLDQMARRKIADEDTAEARALLKQAAGEMKEDARQKHGKVRANNGERSEAEVDNSINLLAGKLGLTLVPIGSQAAAGAGVVAEEPKPPDEPLSG